MPYLPFSLCDRLQLIFSKRVYFTPPTESKTQSGTDAADHRPTSSKKSRKSLEQLENDTVIGHAIGPLDSCCRPHAEGETTTTQDGGITVDYIFYTSAPAPTRKGTSLTLHKRFGLPDSDHIKAKGSIPNPFHSSDHLPVAAYFTAHDNTAANGAVVQRNGRL